MEELEINGIKYRKRPASDGSRSRVAPMLMGMMMMA